MLCPLRPFKCKLERRGDVLFRMEESRRHREREARLKIEALEACAESRRLQILDREALEDAATVEADSKRRLSIMHLAKMNGVDLA